MDFLMWAGLERPYVGARFLRPLVFVLILAGLFYICPIQRRRGNPPWLPKSRAGTGAAHTDLIMIDRKSTRLNSSHSSISYAVFCLKKKENHQGKSKTYPIPDDEASSLTPPCRV